MLREFDEQSGSWFMHDSVHEKQLLEVKLLRNDFPLTKTDKHHLLIAGGIGITPILSMLKSLKANNASYEVHYAVRSVQELAFQMA